jgi:GT2 family glycosyltransferase
MSVNQQFTVSAVIPTYNRLELLCRILPSYLHSPLVAEVIVVDDAGTDGTAERVRRWMADEPRLHYSRNDHNLGLPATRNRGASLACGDWILQSEDDLALGEGYVATLFEHGIRTGADVIAGRRIWMRLGETEAQALARADRSPNPPFRERWLDIDSHAITSGDVEVPLLNATMLVRREVFDRVQYDPQFGGPSSWREESDFQLSALEQGYKLVFCPHAVAYHYSRASQSYGRNRLRGTAVYAYRVYHNNLVFLRRHQDYLRAHHPRALLFGSPLASALRYGAYRAAWLLAAEVVRAWRARKYGAFTWE